MPVHLMVDLGTGLLLAASPWLFGFADGTPNTDGVWVPHLVLGLAEVGTALMTRRVPDDRAASAPTSASSVPNVTTVRTYNGGAAGASGNTISGNTTGGSTLSGTTGSDVGTPTRSTGRR